MTKYLVSRSPAQTLTWPRYLSQTHKHNHVLLLILSTKRTSNFGIIITNVFWNYPMKMKKTQQSESKYPLNLTPVTDGCDGYKFRTDNTKQNNLISSTKRWYPLYIINNLPVLYCIDRFWYIHHRLPVIPVMSVVPGTVIKLVRHRVNSLALILNTPAHLCL